VLGILKRKKIEKLEGQLAQVDVRLALTKAELAAQLIKLAGQTSDEVPLVAADDALSVARDLFGFEGAPVEICLVQIALGDMYLKLGREASDKSMLTQAKAAYRTAITMASVQGDDDLRAELRMKVKLINSHLGQGPKTPSLFRAA
jgi:hypothetical protein